MATFEGFPLVIGWELTLSCNLRCRHCGSSAGLSRVNELTLDEALAICDQFPSLLVQEVDFTGGEPLLRPDWPQIAARLRELEIRTKVVTNGLSLTPNTVDQIRDAGIAVVGVSIDGLEHTHDAIRGHVGLFRRVIAGIERLLRVDVPVAVMTTVNALNLPEMPAVFDLLRALGIRSWQIQPIFPLGRAREFAELELTREAYWKLGMFISSWWEKALDSGIRLGPADSFGYFTELDPREPPWRGCPAGLLACGITSDGKIKGCLSLPNELIEGDLRKNDLWDIWFHPEAFAYTRQFAAAQLGGACQSCPLAEQCRGGCSAMSYGSTGCFHSDPYCFYTIANLSQTAQVATASLPHGRIAHSG